MLSDLFVEKNRMHAFTCYVRDWKKQDPSIIERNGEIFSYRTKRGLVKRFIPAERWICPQAANNRIVRNWRYNHVKHELLPLYKHP